MIIIIISCPWTSVAVLTMESSSFDLDSILRLFFRLPSLLDLFGFSLVAGFLASSSPLSSSSSPLSLSLALCMMPCNMFAFTSSMTRPALLCTENCFFRLIETFNRTVHSAGQRAVAAFSNFSGVTWSLCTCLLHGFGCFCDGFRDHGLAAIFLQLAYLHSSQARPLVRVCTILLCLSTFCLITMSFVFTSDNGPGGALATWETDWLSSTFSASVLEISSVLLATVWAGSHMWTGLTVARDMQLGSCCQREMFWCGSQLWIVHWLSRLVRTSRLNFLL